MSRGKALSSARWASAGGALRVAIQMLQLFILARILPPEDFGLMAIATMTLAFVLAVGEFGLGSALIHRKTSTAAQQATLFWFSIALTLVVLLILWPVGFLLEILRDQEQLASMIAGGGVIGLVAVIGSQPRALAEKQMGFPALIRVELIAQLAGLLIALAVALLGYGVMALLAGAFVNHVLASLLLWAVIARSWPPAPRVDLAQVHAFLKFGRSLTLSRLVNFFASNIDLIGATSAFSARQLGEFSVPRALAMQIQGVVTPIVTRVGFPLIASVNENDMRVRAVYLTILNAAASINAPIYASLFFFADSVTLVLLGPQWSDSAAVLEVLAIWGLLRSMSGPVGSLLLGRGRPDMALKCDLAVTVVMLLMVASAVSYGPVVLSTAMAFAMVLVYLPIWGLLVLPLSNIGLFAYMRATLFPVLLAFLSGWSIKSLLTLPAGEVSQMVVGTLCLFVAYLLLSCAFNRAFLSMMVDLVRRNPQ